MNCYSTFILTNKNLKNNVLNHRMNLLINYYVANNNINRNKSDYINYYISNFNDTFLNKQSLLPFPITFNDKNSFNDISFVDDINDNFYSQFYPKFPPEDTIDYDEIDKKFYQEEEDKLNNQFDNYNDYNDYDDYDDYDYDCDYYDDYYDDYEEVDSYYLNDNY